MLDPRQILDELDRFLSLDFHLDFSKYSVVHRRVSVCLIIIVTFSVVFGSFQVFCYCTPPFANAFSLLILLLRNKLTVLALCSQFVRASAITLLVFLGQRPFITLLQLATSCQSLQLYVTIVLSRCYDFDIAFPVLAIRITVGC